MNLTLTNKITWSYVLYSLQGATQTETLLLLLFSKCQTLKTTAIEFFVDNVFLLKLHLSCITNVKVNVKEIIQGINSEKNHGNYSYFRIFWFEIPSLNAIQTIINSRKKIIRCFFLKLIFGYGNILFSTNESPFWACYWLILWVLSW